MRIFKRIVAIALSFSMMLGVGVVGLDNKGVSSIIDIVAHADIDTVDQSLMSDEVKNMLNTTSRTPGITEIPVYDRKNGGGSIEFTIHLKEDDYKILEKFASEHFTADMTLADKLLVTHQWIHYNVDYAYAGSKWDAIESLSYPDAIFNHKSGQCVQYNGAMAAMLCYFGYKAYVVKGVTSGQHYWCECEIDGARYYVETGNHGKNGDSWQYFFSPAESSSHSYTNKSYGNDTTNPNPGGQLPTDENIVGENTADPGQNSQALDNNAPNSALASDDDNSWVRVKDMFRHGGQYVGVSDENADNGENADNTSSGTRKGSATGEYAITLQDGSWYWYHQTTAFDDCVHCGTWSKMSWGSGGYFGSDGCAQYSMSIIISNLLGKAVTPNDWLSSIGCKINDSKTHCDTGPCDCISGHAITDRNTLLKHVKETYSLEVSEDLYTLSKEEAEKRAIEILDNEGGMIWYKYGAGTGFKGGWWPSYSCSTHYIAIRAHDEKGFYILDECMKNGMDKMNEPVSWDALWYGIGLTPQQKYMYGLWDPNATNVNNNGESSVSGSGSLAGIKIGIDPGHQAKWMSDTEASAPNFTTFNVNKKYKYKCSSGCTGVVTKVPEYKTVLEIGLKLKTALEAEGATVVMTRTTHDVQLSNQDRAKMMNNAKVDVWVRVHTDSISGDSGKHGCALYCSKNATKADESKKYCEIILPQIIDATQAKNQGIWQNDNYTGQNWSEVPCFMIECGFSSNPDEDRKLVTPEYQDKIVTGMVNGFKICFKDKVKSSVSNNNTSNITVNDNGTTKLSGTNTYQIQSAVKDTMSEIDGQGGKWQVQVLSLTDSSKSFSTGNCTGKMISASLIKMFVAGAVYENYDKVKKQGSDTDHLIEIMITKSDNDACNTLIKRLGDGNADKGFVVINDYCNSHGFKDSQINRLMLVNDGKQNYTTTNDCINFMKSCYNNSLKGSAEIIGYMKKQTLTSKIPAGVPSSVAVANKTGSLSNVENDSAIVYAKSGVYFMCVISTGLSNCEKARKSIKNTSKKVYEYMVR